MCFRDDTVPCTYVLIEPRVGSYVVQIAQVAIDPATGQLRVLGISTALDVAEVVNPVTHQLQVDGGVVMGFGYACLEDLDESGGQVWAANLGEYKLPSSRDAPPLSTVLVPGGIGVGTGTLMLLGTLVPLVHIYKQLKGAYGLSRFSAVWRTVALSVLIWVIVFLFIDVLLVLGAVD